MTDVFDPGAQFARALASKDAIRLRALLAPEINFRDGQIDGLRIMCAGYLSDPAAQAVGDAAA